MTINDAIKELAGALGQDPKQDEGIKYGLTVLLKLDVKLNVPTIKEPEPERGLQNKQRQKPGPKKKFDTGKMIACYKAGRSISWIADEMGTTPATVRAHLKKEGVIQ